MSVNRSRRETKTYDRYLKAMPDPSICEFCLMHKKRQVLQLEKKHFYIVRNLFPYSLWDGQNVTDHLMIVPKRHVDSLAALKAAEKTEYLEIVSDYEVKGYNLYARTPGSVMKTVVHQHTHLIKTNGGPRRLIFLLRRPYIRIVR